MAERDEPLFEISTDKVDAEIPAPAAGILKEIKVNAGQTVPVQTIVATIDSAGAASAARGIAGWGRLCRRVRVARDRRCGAADRPCYHRIRRRRSQGASAERSRHVARQ